MNRWIALMGITLLAGACARGGEGDADAALVDSTAQSAELIGDTAMPAPAATDSTVPMDTAAMDHSGHAMDSTAAPAADEHAAHGDSAAH